MPDQMMPSHASMVHGLAFEHPMEIASLAGVCMSGLMALKTSYMSIKSGNSSNAICTASELISPTMLSKFFNEEIAHRKLIEGKPYLAFEKDFLRFMLSDGAAALYLSDKIETKNSLRIEWIKTYSYANLQPACMYMWAEKEESGELLGWKNFSAKEMSERSIWALKQDVRQLNKYAMLHFVDAVESSLKETGTGYDNITYVIPHVSSMYFYDLLVEEFKNRGIELPTNKWFTNLTTVGNIGSASPFVALDEFIRTRQLKKGETILLIVPESGRFSCGTALLTVM
jgi:3-oxoacyl-[acyl-carrier-protein] synthase-3